MAQKKQKKEKSSYNDVPMKVLIREGSEGSFTFKEATKNFGLLEDNRRIDYQRVDLFVAKINEGRYYDEYPVMCYEAANLAGLGKRITDFDGKEIPNDKLSDYLIIVDGQHRVAAFNKYNNEIADNKKAVPNVNILKADNPDDVLKFLVAINIAGKDWSDSDRWKIARNVNNESVKQIINLIKEYGFKQSTAQKIYLSKRLSRKEFISFLDGNSSIIDNMERIEIGDKFIEACLTISKRDTKKMKLFSKRYFIDGFDEFSKGKTHKDIFEAMIKLKYEDLKDNVQSDEDFKKMLKTVYK